MPRSDFFQQWHASLEAQAAKAHVASAAPAAAGPSQERPSRLFQDWHAALEEQAQLAARAVHGTHNAAVNAPPPTAVPTRQREIKRLFRVVEKALASAECIGVKHPLFAEWQELQQHYAQLEAEYQANVRSCSTYLIRNMHVFHPDAVDGPNVVQANAALTGILRVVRLMQDDAKRVEYRIYDLQDEIEAFPARVMHATGSGKPRSRGLSGWLKKLRASLSKPVRALLQALGRPGTRPHAHIRLGSSDNVAVQAEKHDYAGRAAQSSAPSMADCQLLLNALSDLVDTSQLIERACDDILQAGYLGSLTSSTLVRGEYMVAAYHGSAKLYTHLDLVARM